MQSESPKNTELMQGTIYHVALGLGATGWDVLINAERGQYQAYHEGDKKPLVGSSATFRLTYEPHVENEIVAIYRPARGEPRLAMV